MTSWHRVSIYSYHYYYCLFCTLSFTLEIKWDTENITWWLTKIFYLNKLLWSFELVTTDLLALHKLEFVFVRFVSCSICYVHIHRTFISDPQRELITNDSKRIILEVLWIQLQRVLRSFCRQHSHIVFFRVTFKAY